MEVLDFEKNHLESAKQIAAANYYEEREVDNICNICGAFCLPEYRGKNIYQNELYDKEVKWRRI